MRIIYCVALLFYAGTINILTTRPVYKTDLDEYDRAAKATGVDPDLIRAIAFAESGAWANQPDLRRRITSSAGAIGIMQVHPAYAGKQECPQADLTDPQQNIMCGAKYLRWLKDSYCTTGRIECLASAYLNGPGLRHTNLRNSETTNYIRRVNHAFEHHRTVRQSIQNNNHRLSGRGNLIGWTVSVFQIGFDRIIGAVL